MPDRDEATLTAFRPERTKAGGALRALRFWAPLLLVLIGAFLLDHTVMHALRPIHESAWAQFVQRFVRPLGTGHLQAGILILLLALGAWRAHHGAVASGKRGVLALLVSGLAANLLKVVIHRPRPWVEAPQFASWWAAVQYSARESELRSFPSAESATTFAIVVVIGVLLPRTRLPLLIVAALVAAGRVMVGAHFPSDVIAGAMLGLALGRIMAGPAARRKAEARAERREQVLV